jgi:hypothetical protein
MIGLTIPLPEQVAQWIEDIAGHAQAARAIGELDRTAATNAIRDYLRRGPQIVPQPRVFAVAMLARWNAPGIVPVLREVLQSHPLHGLTPQLAESEYVVKNAVMDVLAGRDYAELPEDIALGIDERLPAAVRAAGCLRRHELADRIANLFDDDVLAGPAAQTLRSFGAHALPGVLSRLDAWLWQSDANARARLGAIRSLQLLAEIGVDLRDDPQRIVGRALRDAHPLVRAAAAVIAWRQGADVIEPLVRGLLGHDVSVAQACESVLANAGPMLTEPALIALERNEEPDLYGQRRAPDPEQRRTLVRRMLAAAVASPASMRTVLGCRADVLADAIAHAPALNANILRVLLEHENTGVRAAARSALERAGHAP